MEALSDSMFLDFADDKLAAGLVNHEAGVLGKESDAFVLWFQRAFFRELNPAWNRLSVGRKMTDDDLRAAAKVLSEMPGKMPSALQASVKTDLVNPLRQKRYCEARILYVPASRDASRCWHVNSLRVRVTRERVCFVHHVLPFAIDRHVVERFQVRGVASRRGIHLVASHVLDMVGFVAAFAQAASVLPKSRLAVPSESGLVRGVLAPDDAGASSMRVSLSREGRRRDESAPGTLLMRSGAGSRNQLKYVAVTFVDDSRLHSNQTEYRDEALAFRERHRAAIAAAAEAVVWPKCDSERIFGHDPCSDPVRAMLDDAARLLGNPDYARAIGNADVARSAAVVLPTGRDLLGSLLHGIENGKFVSPAFI